MNIALAGILSSAFANSRLGLLVTVFCPESIQVDARADVDSIITALEWYDTSIQSFRVRYHVVMEPHPTGRRYIIRSHPHANSEIMKEWINRRDEFEVEYVQSYERVWIKKLIVNPLVREDRHAQFISSYDGKELRTLALTTNASPTHGSVAGELRPGIVEDSPTHMAGMRISTRAPALHTHLKAGTLQLKGRIRHEGRDVVQLSGVLWGSNPQEARDDFYLDPQHNFLPVRQEFWWRGKLAVRQTVDEFARFDDSQTSQARWFPSNVTKEYFDNGHPTTTTRVTTRSLEINPVIEDSLFELAMPGGILVTDGQTHRTTISGTEEQRRKFTESFTNKAKAIQEAALATAAQNQRQVHRLSRVPWWSIGVGGIGVGLIIASLILRRRGAA